ncbi:hypothetical protein [Mastigocladopsis repens]|nr:hypothetical protein [Mastigocladopsis repens]
MLQLGTGETIPSKLPEANWQMLRQAKQKVVFFSEENSWKKIYFQRISAW